LPKLDLKRKNEETLPAKTSGKKPPKPETQQPAGL
jgi:hypothetical protein